MEKRKEYVRVKRKREIGRLGDCGVGGESLLITWWLYGGGQNKWMCISMVPLFNS